MNGGWLTRRCQGHGLYVERQGTQGMIQKVVAQLHYPVCICFPFRKNILNSCGPLVTVQTAELHSRAWDSTSLGVLGGTLAYTPHLRGSVAVSRTAAFQVPCSALVDTVVCEECLEESQWVKALLYAS